MKISNRNTTLFLAGWAGINLLGWIIGVFSGFGAGYFYLAPIFSLSFRSPIADALSPLFVWIPFGGSIGFAQLVGLQKWKIQPFQWVLATSLGWGLPAVIITWLNKNLFIKQSIYNSPYKLWFYSLSIIFIGLCIGLAQTPLMGNVIKKRLYWILANGLGLVVCAGLFVVVLVSTTILLPSEESLGSYFHGFLTWTVIMFFSPFVGAISSVPTGAILIKYGIIPSNSDNTVESPSEISQPSLENKNIFPVWKAILAGQLVVNIPVIVIILYVSGLCITLALLLWEIHLNKTIFPSVVIGSLTGWVWWSFSVPRWRQWAIQKGVSENQLQKWGVLTGLLWTKGSIFEKTEFK